MNINKPLKPIKSIIIEFRYLVSCRMNSKLQSLLNSLEAQREEIIERVKRAPDRFDHKPNAHSWSIHQILAHLITAEKLSVKYLEKKLQGIETAGDSGIVEEIKMIVLKASQRLPLKFKAPKKVVEHTPTYSTLSDLLDDWNRTREDLKRQLEKIKDDQIKRKIYRHVVAGKLNIIHAIIFLQEHVSHHLPQINRLLK